MSGDGDAVPVPGEVALEKAELRNKIVSMVQGVLPLRCRACATHKPYNKVDYFLVDVRVDRDQAIAPFYSTDEKDTGGGHPESQFIKHDIWVRGVSPGFRMNYLQCFTQVMWPYPRAEWVPLAQILSMTSTQFSYASLEQIQRSCMVLQISISSQCSMDEAAEKMRVKQKSGPSREEASSSATNPTVLQRSVTYRRLGTKRIGFTHLQGTVPRPQTQKRVEHRDEPEDRASTPPGKKSRKEVVSEAEVAASAEDMIEIPMPTGRTEAPTTVRDLVNFVLDRCGEISVQDAEQILAIHQEAAKGYKKTPLTRLGSILGGFTPDEVVRVLKVRGVHNVKGSSLRRFLFKGDN